MTLVFVVVFAVLTKGIYDGEAPYPIYVLLGTVLWSLFAQGTMQGGNGVLLRSGLIKKVYFPREYVSYSYILTILATTLINLIVFSALYLAYGLRPGPVALLFPAIMGILLLLVVGTSLLLASLFVRLEDLRYLWQLMITLGLFASPIVYEPDVVPVQYAFWYSLNPMVGILSVSRDLLIRGTWPSWDSVLYPAALSVFLFVLGFSVFRRSEHLFAERL